MRVFVMFSVVRRLLIPLALLGGLVPALHADVALPALFSDGMVLQRDVEIPVWGKARAGERVVVGLSGRGAETVADATGAWRVRLPAMPPGGPHSLTVTGDNRLVVSDVMIGEVWFASGQSNMEWIVRESDDAAAEIAAANHPRVRIFRVQRAVADAPSDDCEGKWLVASPQTAGWMTAVGYHFARTLSADLDVPVGVINASRGSARIIPFIPRPAIDGAAVFSEDLARWREAVGNHPGRRAAYEAKLAEAAASGARKPEPPYGPGHYNQPGGLYNGMVAPATPYAIRGFLWYQGEADARRAVQYGEAFPLLIRSWREAWGRGDLPFLFVQLAPYNAPQGGFPAEGTARAELREVQERTLALPATGMVVALDLGGPDSQEHPRAKRPVGERLARLAGSIAYGRGGVVEGPRYRAHRIEGGVVRIAFQPGTAGGLAARGGGEITGFQVAGGDGVFHPASVRVEGETVVVSSPVTPAPVAVRYAFANDPVCNLVNAAGLPAAPFRTDGRDAAGVR